MTAKQPFFEITIELNDVGSSVIRSGTTALVRFQTQSQTIGARLYRSALRFLNKLRS